MKNLLPLVSLLLVISCTAPAPKHSTFADSFQVIPVQDTLIFSVEFEATSEASLKPQDTIATPVFYENVSDSLRASIEHILDGGEPVITSLGRINLDANYDALGVDIQAFWYRNQSLLLFNKQLHKVTGLLSMAEFYGGDGGQVLRKSWLLGTANTDKTWIARDSQHTLSIKENEEEPQDLYAESVMRYIWQKNTFVVQPTPDSTALIQHFPVRWE